MAKRGLFTKILAILGTVFVWLPILAPIIFSVALLIRSGMFRMDYLMPAELFPLVLVGGGLLLWAALRAHSQRKIIDWSLRAAAGTLILSQVIAIMTGLASGAIEPTGLPWLVVVALLIAYDIAVISMGIGGVLLLRNLFMKSESH